MARATVAGVTIDTLTLSLKSPISPHLLQQGARTTSASGQQHAMLATWRVDRDDVSSVFVRMRQSLLGAPARPAACASHAFIPSFGKSPLFLLERHSMCGHNKASDSCRHGCETLRSCFHAFEHMHNQRRLACTKMILDISCAQGAHTWLRMPCMGCT